MVLGSDLRRGNVRRGRGPRSRGRGTALAAALALFLAPALAACSDDSGGGDEATPPTPSAERTTTEPSPSGPADTAAAEKEIRQNWATFFDPTSSKEDRQAVLENGERMGPVLDAFSGDERGQQVEAEVTEVEFTSATDADVTYSLLMKGATVLPDSAGTAVEQDGTWKVSVRTLCGLVGLSGASPVPGC